VPSRRTDDPNAGVARYAQPHLGRSLADLATSLVPYLALVAAMVILEPTQLWAVLLLAVPTAAFQLRTFIVFHDCAHGSFLPWRSANIWLGRVLGVLVYTPFGAWKASHARHHASAGDLGRRGDGDVPTMTVAEWFAASPKTRLVYRLTRHPAIMFTIGPLLAMIILPRLTSKKMKPRCRRSVLLNDAALLAVVVGFVLLFGWQMLLLVQGPAILISGAAGVWLFFVQHQFEDVYWESPDAWSYEDAALRGSSYLKLPQPLQFLTGNIGLHHVHHLNARIPNYNLQAAHDGVPACSSVPVLTLREGMRATRLKLWCEESRRLVTFREARPPAVAVAA
jgi:acyl-lipid omega-6 desaturase (Delta-12 desaturase)